MTVAAKHQLTIQGDTDGLKRVRAFVGEVVLTAGIDGKLRNLITVAIDEAVTNIMKHALEEERQDSIDLIVEISAVRLEVVIRDSGCTFNPKEIQEPDLSKMVQDGRKGGLGIFLMRRIMDEVEYIFHEGVRNELRMVKYL